MRPRALATLRAPMSPLHCSWCGVDIESDEGFRATEPEGERTAAFCRLEHIVPWAIQGAHWEPGRILSPGDPVLAAMAHDQDPPAAERAAALRASPEAVVGLAGREHPARLPVRPLDRPRHDVLEPAERRPALALGLGRSEPLVAADLHAAPAAVQGTHRGAKRS